MNNNDNINIINQIVNNELINESKKKIWTTIIGISVLVFVLGYFVYLSNAFNKYLNNENISSILASNIPEGIKENYPKAEANVISVIPGLMSQFKRQSLNSLRSSRVSSNEYLKVALKEIFERVNKILENEIKSKGTSYRIKIAKQLELISNPKTAQKELEGIDVVIKESIFNEVEKYFDFSLTKLKNIEEKMEDILTKSELTEDEKQIKTFIKYWVNFFEMNFKMK